MSDDKMPIFNLERFLASIGEDIQNATGQAIGDGVIACCSSLGQVLEAIGKELTAIADNFTLKTDGEDEAEIPVHIVGRDNYNPSKRGGPA